MKKLTINIIIIIIILILLIACKESTVAPIVDPVIHPISEKLIYEYTFPIDGSSTYVIDAPWLDFADLPIVMVYCFKDHVTLGELWAREDNVYGVTLTTNTIYISGNAGMTYRIIILR